MTEEQYTISDFEKKLLKYKQRVRSVLEEFPETRDEDKILIIRYLSKYHPALGIKPSRLKMEFLNRIPAFETITRVRRKVQNEDFEFMSTKRAYAGRKRKEELMHDNINNL